MVEKNQKQTISWHAKIIWGSNLGVHPYSFIETLPHTFIYLWSKTFPLPTAEFRSYDGGLNKVKNAIWLFTGRVCQSPGLVGHWQKRKQLLALVWTQVASRALASHPSLLAAQGASSMSTMAAFDLFSALLSKSVRPEMFRVVIEFSSNV